MCRNLIPMLTLCLAASGCGLSNHYCVDGSGSECGNGSCSERLVHRLACGSGCGEVYWGEWISDPPDCADPCDQCGNYVGPRLRVASCLTWSNLFGQRTGSCDCGVCAACLHTTCDCGFCDSYTSTFETWSGDDEVETQQIQFEDAVPFQSPTPPPDQVQFQRVRRGNPLIHMASSKILGHRENDQRASAKRPIGFRE